MKLTIFFAIAALVLIFNANKAISFIGPYTWDKMNIVCASSDTVKKYIKDNKLKAVAAGKPFNWKEGDTMHIYVSPNSHLNKKYLVTITGGSGKTCIVAEMDTDIAI